MKVMENLEKVEAVLYILNVTSRIKDYAFQINRILQTEVKRRKIQVKKQKMQNLWLYSTKWSHINKDKRDCRTFQLVKQFVHSWIHLKRAIIYHFVL